MAAPQTRAASEDKLPRRRVAISSFSGKQGKKVRAWVAEQLKDGGVEIVSDPALDLTPTSTDAEVAKAARGRVDAVIVGSVSGWTLSLALRNGADGAVLAEPEYEGGSAKALQKALATELSTDLRDALEKSRARSDSSDKAAAGAPEKPASTGSEETADAKEERAEPADEAPNEESAATAATDDAPTESDVATSADSQAGSAAAAPARSWLELTLGARGFSRNLTYEDAIPATFPEYSLGAAPAAFLAGRFYPLAEAPSAILQNLALIAGYEQGIAIKSRVPTGEELESSARSYYGGLRERVLLGAHELGVSASYGEHSFEVEGDEANPLVPDVKYSFLRVGVDAQFRIQKVVFGLHIGRRFVLGTGQFEASDWFPHLNAGGLDAGAFGGVALSPRFDLLAGFDMHRYFLDLNPQATDAIVTSGRGAAGGALDQYLSGWLGLRWQLDNTP